jgi:hypothetical protein
METTMNAEATFRAKAPAIVAQLRSDFPFSADDGCAVAGNGGHESLGFTKLQEIKPTVAGSRGGWGWFQWTGSRRRAFEAYCKRHDLDPASDKANYAWLFLELKGSERKAVPATIAAAGRDAKVIAFEKSFLRAGVKHYPSRQQWAALAADAYAKAGSPVGVLLSAPEKKAVLEDEAKAQVQAAGTKTVGGALATSVTAGGGQLAGLPIWAVVVAVAVIVAVIGWRVVKHAGTAGALNAAAKEI